jgi:methionyl-tRNA synthetase
MPGIFFRARAGTVVSLSANIANLLSVLLNPYMPAVLKILGASTPKSLNRIAKIYQGRSTMPEEGGNLHFNKYHQISLYKKLSAVILICINILI